MPTQTCGVSQGRTLLRKAALEANEKARQTEEKEKMTWEKQKAIFEKEERERTPTIWKKRN